MKTFQGFWGTGYIGVFSRAKTETLPMSFFTDRNGYFKEAVAKIDSLEIAESYQDNSCGPHSVVRIS